MTYKQYKTAGDGSIIAGIVPETMQAITAIGTTGAVYLLAAAAMGGIGLGYAAANITAHGKQDIDTAKKEYENERLKADLGYMKGKLNSEYQAFKNQQTPKPARVLV